MRMEGAGLQLLDRPMVTAAPIEDLEAHTSLRLPACGRFGDFSFVRISDGREGWILL